MDLNARRKMIFTQYKGTEFEVSSDGRTVWVNKLIMVARFCPVSREYAAVSATDSSTGIEYEEEAVAHPESGPSLADWTSFVGVVKDRWGIVIGQNHTPLYIQRTDVRTSEATPTP
jgi:hypothetical protein